MTNQVRKILDCYRSENPGVLTNLARMLNHGRLAGTGRMLILPVDQGFEHGPARSFAPNPPAYDPAYHFQLAIDAGLNAYASLLGFIDFPGVRENGAQYTHAAVWAAIAFAAIGDNRRAWELLSIINPVNHAASAESIAIYKVEPYVVASDVYALSPAGRGGWTWYSGSAGWMYRLIVESILGLRREADKLHFEPCVPAHRTSFKMSYRYRETVYRVTVSQLQEVKGAPTLTVDDVERLDLVVPLVDDRQKHEVVLHIHTAQS